MRACPTSFVSHTSCDRDWAYWIARELDTETSTCLLDRRVDRHHSEVNLPLPDSHLAMSVQVDARAWCVFLIFTPRHRTRMSAYHP